MTPRNRIKDAAYGSQSVRGVNLTFPAPPVIEVLASLGIDFVFLDGEHGCFDIRDIEVACIAAERHGLSTLARVPDIRKSTITRFLDRGVQGIMAPHVDSVDDAKAVIDAAYFPPLGNRSYGAGRPDYGQQKTALPTYMARCNEIVSICAMIEGESGLAQAGKIAALPGIDYLTFGLIDLSQALGYPGDPKNPNVQAAVAAAKRDIAAAGKRLREDFMISAWTNDMLIEGAKKILGIQTQEKA